MTSYTNSFGGQLIQSENETYKAISMSANVTLSWPTQFQNTNPVVADRMDLTATVGGLSLFFPTAQEGSTGASVVFANIGGVNSVAIKDNTGLTLVNLAAGNVVLITLTSNATIAGTWSIIPFGGGVAAVTSVGLSSPSDNLVITNSPINSAGTIVLNLAKDLASLTSFGVGARGYGVRTGSNTWSLRAIDGTANQIDVTFGDGVGGDTNIALAPNIIGLTSIRVGNLSLGTNTIASTDSNGNIDFVPDGTGQIRCHNIVSMLTAKPIRFYNLTGSNYISLQGGNTATNIALILPTTAPVSGQVLAATGTSQLQWANVTTYAGVSTDNALARYDGVAGSLQNSGVLLSDTNDITQVGSLSTENLGFAFGSLNTISALNANGNVLLAPNGSGNVGLSNILYPNTDGTESSVLTTNGALSIGWSANVNKNLLINGCMSIWQRNTTINSTSAPFVNNNNTYAADCWKLLSNGNNIANLSRSTNAPQAATFSSPYSMQTTVIAAQKYGVIQIMEFKNTKQLINSVVSLSFAGLTTGLTGGIRAAILGWTGTADTPTSDPISAWNGVGVNPTLAANWVYVTTPTVFTLGATWSRFKVQNVTITPTTIKNLAVFFYTDSVPAIAQDWSISAVKLELGPQVTLFSPMNFSQEILECQRFFRKDFPVDTPVYSATTHSAQSKLVTRVNSISNNVSVCSVNFDTPMRTTPTTIVTYPSTTVTTSYALSDNTGTDLGVDSAAVAPNSDMYGFRIINTSGGAIATSEGYYICHWYADASF